MGGIEWGVGAPILYHFAVSLLVFGGLAFKNIRVLGWFLQLWEY